jgi:hypothetical protein
MMRNLFVYLRKKVFPEVDLRTFLLGRIIIWVLNILSSLAKSTLEGIKVSLFLATNEVSLWGNTNKVFFGGALEMLFFLTNSINLI